VLARSSYAYRTVGKGLSFFNFFLIFFLGGTRYCRTCLIERTAAYESSGDDDDDDDDGKACTRFGEGGRKAGIRGTEKAGGSRERENRNEPSFPTLRCDI